MLILILYWADITRTVLVSGSMSAFSRRTLLVCGSALGLYQLVASIWVGQAWKGYETMIVVDLLVLGVSALAISLGFIVYGGRIVRKLGKPGGAPGATAGDRRSYRLSGGT